jgi:type III secretory pathway component EscT
MPEEIEAPLLILRTARFVPLVVLVPVLALRGAPASFRAGIALILAAASLPAGATSSTSTAAIVSLDTLVRELWLGLPVALGAAVPLWSLSMVGGTIDSVLAASPFGPGGAASRSFSRLFELIAGLIFLSSGGLARAVSLLSSASVALDGANAAHAAATAVSSGIGVAVVIATPVLMFAFMVDVTLAMIARAAWPVALTSAIAATRAPLIIVLVSLLLERLL